VAAATQPAAHGGDIRRFDAIGARENPRFNSQSLAEKWFIGLAAVDSLGLRNNEGFAMPWDEADRKKYAVVIRARSIQAICRRRSSS
jgi:hypothetical protein